MRNKEKIGSLLSLGLGVGIIVALVVFILAQLYAFFNTGAKKEDILNLSKVATASHTPYFAPINTSNVIGRKLEANVETKLKTDYASAWYLMNNSLNAEADPSATFYFAEKPFNNLQQIAKKNISEEYYIERVDLSHHINLYLYSIDGQVVSFRDSSVLLKERVLSADRRKTFANSIFSATYDVTMVLNDGNWRIRHIVPLHIDANIAPTDFSHIANNNFVQTQENSFSFAGTSFVPSGINYYPAKNGWLAMWDNFDSEVIDKDFNLIKSLGVNTVRIFIPYNSFGKGNVKTEQLLKLDQVLALAKKNNLFVIVTLFDFIHDYSLANWAKSDRHLEKILTRYKNNTEILAWDLKNEADLDYRDHGEKFVNEWLEFIIQRARFYDPNHLLTVGWSSPEAASRYCNELDFTAFHYYGDPKFLNEKINVLQSKTNKKPLMLEEFGQSTYHAFYYLDGHNEQEQYDYYLQSRKILKANNNIAYMAWSLHDFQKIPNYVVGKGFFAQKIQEHFGLFDKKGKAKPAAKLLNPYFELN